VPITNANIKTPATKWGVTESNRSTSGLKDALLPLHDSKLHIGAQANSLISETANAPDPAAAFASNPFRQQQRRSIGHGSNRRARRFVSI
jgi:hypothetical protein